MRMRQLASEPAGLPGVFSGVKRFKARGNRVYVEFFGGVEYLVASANPDQTSPEAAE